MGVAASLSVPSCASPGPRRSTATARTNWRIAQQARGSRAYRFRSLPSGSRGATRSVSEWATKTRPGPPFAGFTCFRRVTCTSTSESPARLAEEGRHLGRLPQVVGPGPALVVAEDDVRSGHVARVQPQVLGARHAEGQVVVLARVAADEHGQTAAGQVVARAGGAVRAARARGLAGPGQLASVAGVQHERLALARRGELRACLAPAQLDLVARPLDAPGLVEHPLGVGEPSEARVEGDGEEPPGLVGVLDLDRLAARLDSACEGQEGLRPTAQVASRRRAPRGPGRGSPPAARGAGSAGARRRGPRVDGARTRARGGGPRGRAPPPRARTADGGRSGSLRGEDRGESDRGRVGEVDVVPGALGPRHEEDRRRLAEPLAQASERDGTSIRLTRERRAEAGTGGEHRAHEGAALGPRRGHGRLESRQVESVPLALRRLRRQRPCVGPLAEAAEHRPVDDEAQRREPSRRGAGRASRRRPGARPRAPRPRARARGSAHRPRASSGGGAPVERDRGRPPARYPPASGRPRAAASRRRPSRARRPARGSGRASPRPRTRPRFRRRGGAGRGAGRRPAAGARPECGRA